MQAAVHVPARSPLLRLAPWAWLLLPLACHLGFSWIGFNPTDDGWMQAVARRMLDGEFPHRDFIFVRPALSALLQVPLVWLGGDHVIWLSRLWGWLTLGGVAWLWSGFAQRGGPPVALRYLLYAAAFFLCAHCFPVMAWHSIDGMLLCTVAVWGAARGTTGGLRLAFVCAGLAALCRQNFAFFAPVLLLAVADPRKWRAMWWAALPPLVYLGAMLAAGCLREFCQQAASTGGALRFVAWDNYLSRPLFLGLIPVGALAALLRQQSRAGRWWAALTALAAAGFAAGSLWFGPAPFHDAAYGLLGLAGGLTLTMLVRDRRLAPDDRLPLVAGLGLAWVTAISIGWNSPALMAGVLLILIWRAAHHGLPGGTNPAGNRSLVTALLIVVVTGVAFRHARYQFPYRDAPPAELSFEAGPVFPGAAGLRTNARTYAVLLDLRQLLDRCAVEKKPYALLTDGAALWIRSPQRNPLPCEWPQVTELGYDARLIGRTLDAVHRLPPDTQIIVQRVLISELGRIVTLPPANYDYFFVQNWVRAHARKTGETAFFEIYAPPVAPAAVRRD